MREPKVGDIYSYSPNQQITRVIQAIDEHRYTYFIVNLEKDKIDMQSLSRDAFHSCIERKEFILQPKIHELW